MISLEERERAEKIRSALEASQTTTRLSLPAKTIARYRAPSKTTVYPLEYAFHLLGEVNGKTVLEYGCGDGLNTVILANHGARVIAFDISDQLLALARKRVEANRCDRVQLLLGSAHALPLKDESNRHHLWDGNSSPSRSQACIWGGSARVTNCQRLLLWTSSKNYPRQLRKKSDSRLRL